MIEVAIGFICIVGFAGLLGALGMFFEFIEAKFSVDAIYYVVWPVIILLSILFCYGVGVMFFMLFRGWGA